MDSQPISAQVFVQIKISTRRSIQKTKLLLINRFFDEFKLIQSILIIKLFVIYSTINTEHSTIPLVDFR